MVTCTGHDRNLKHPLIAHNEFFCPLCVVMEDLRELEETTAKEMEEVENMLREEIKEAN